MKLYQGVGITGSWSEQDLIVIVRVCFIELESTCQSYYRRLLHSLRIIPDREAHIGPSVHEYAVDKSVYSGQPSMVGAMLIAGQSRNGSRSRPTA